MPQDWHRMHRAPVQTLVFRRATTGVLIVLCFFAAPSQAGETGLPGPLVPAGFGVNIHFTDPAPGEMVRFAEAGFALARIDLAWDAVERRRGVYDFGAYDRLVAHLAKAGTRPLFILDYGNPLYDDRRPPRTRKPGSPSRGTPPRRQAIFEANAFCGKSGMSPTSFNSGSQRPMQPSMPRSPSRPPRRLRTPIRTR